MSEPIDLNALAAAVAKIHAPAPAGPAVLGFAPAPSGFAAPAPAAGLPQPVGVLIPVNVSTPAGEVTIQFLFGPEYAQPAVAQQVLLALGQANWPIRAYVPKPRDNGWGGGGGRSFGNRGGYGNNGNGGGWNR